MQMQYSIIVYTPIVHAVFSELSFFSADFILMKKDSQFSSMIVTIKRF